MSNLNRERNFDLIRSILLEIESFPPNSIVRNLTIENYDPAVIILHVEMLNDAGFIDAQISKTQCGPTGYQIKKILPNGYDFLDNAKNDTIWKKFQAEAEKKGSSMSMAIANGLLTAAAKKYFDL